RELLAREMIVREGPRRMPGLLARSAAALLLAGILVLAPPARGQAPTTTTTIPACAFAGAIDVWVVNETDQPSIAVTVDGDRDSAAATCGGDQALREHYSRSFTCDGAGLVRCSDGDAPARVDGLRPGAWVHRLTVAPPAGQPAEQRQHQARRGVVVAPSDTT